MHIMSKSKTLTGIASFTHLLHRAGQSTDEMFEKQIAAAGAKCADLTARQAVILDTVSWRGTLSQTDICMLTGIDRSTLADIVRRLVSKGLLARRRTKSDLRKYAVRLTDEGQRALDQALPVLQDVDKRVQSVVAPVQRAEMVAALQRVANAGTKST